MISSTIIRITATVRWPSSDPSPSPTMKPMIASSSIQRPVRTMSDVGRGQEHLGVVRVVLLGDLTAARPRSGPGRCGGHRGSGRALDDRAAGPGPLPHGTALRTVPIVGTGCRRREVEVADHLVGVVGRPVLEAGAGQTGGDVDAVVAELGRGGEHAHRADDGEADRHQRHDDGQAGRDPRQVERQPRTAGHHQVAEHPLGEVDRPGRAARAWRRR